MGELAELTLTDVCEVSYLTANGVRLLRVEADPIRCRFILRDDARATALREKFVHNYELKAIWSKRRLLARAIDLARSTPSGIVTARDLAIAADADAAAKAAAR